MRTLVLRLTLALALLSNPAFASGASPAMWPSVTVDDVVAGFETAVQVTGLAPQATVDLHVVSPSSDDTTLPVTADAQGAGKTSIPSALTAEAGLYRVFVVAGKQKIGDEAHFEVLSDRVDPILSQINASTPVIPADGRSVATVTVTLQDAHGNPLPGRPVQLIGSRAEDRIAALSTTRDTDVRGQISFAVQTQTPGDIALRAIDLLSGTMLTQVAHVFAAPDSSMGGFAGWNAAPAYPSAGWMPPANPFVGQVTPGAAPAPTGKAYDVVDHFEITVSTPTAKVKDVIPLVTVKAVDAKGAVVESYVGEALMTSPTDPNATLPGLPPSEGAVKFAAKNRGVVTFPWAISFSRGGTHTLEVKDDTGAVTGKTSVTVTGTTEIPENRKIRVDSPANGETVNSREAMVKGKGPVLTNLVVWAVDASTPIDSVTASDPVGLAETQDDGTFGFVAPLPANSVDVILQIQDEGGQYDSGPIRVKLDTEGPAIAYTLEPAEPKEGETITLRVTSEPGLPSVAVDLPDRQLLLTESIPGSYQLLFPAPSRGDAAFTVSATDPAGNTTRRSGTLSVTGPLIPQVQNVRVQALAGGLELTWDPIPDPTITGYRIEVGRGPGRVDTTLDTPEVTDSASIMGLKGGIDYFLYVRAARGEEKGPPSIPVISRTLGMELNVTPQEGGLLLQWTFPDATPLSQFLLEFGSMEGEFSEKRPLDGAMRAYTLKDLLAQPYLIRLTPVAITGESLIDLAVVVQGTPLPLGAFHASAEEIGMIPTDTVPPDDTLHEGAPEVTHTGLPPISPRWALGGAGLLLGYYWYRRKKSMRDTRQFLNAMNRTYHS